MGPVRSHVLWIVCVWACSPGDVSFRGLFYFVGYVCNSVLKQLWTLLKCWAVQSNMAAVTTVGAGLLVGTALAVIIPEGVHSLYSAG